MKGLSYNIVICKEFGASLKDSSIKSSLEHLVADPNSGTCMKLLGPPSFNTMDFERTLRSNIGSYPEEPPLQIPDWPMQG